MSPPPPTSPAPGAASPRGAARPTIRDVAAHAGVAIKTVSRVLNRHAYVSAETREKVETAMRALDFRPSIAARILSGARSNQIALIHDNHSPHYLFQVQQGCWSACREAHVRLLSQVVDVADPAIGEVVRGFVTETQVDGIVLSSPVADSPAVLAALEAMELPFVRISPAMASAREGSASVFIDDAAAARAMTAHLIGQGHRSIAFVQGHPNHLASAERLLGFRQALIAAGLRSEGALIQPGLFDFDSGYAAGERLLRLRPRPTAVFAANDDMAAGVLAAAHAAGLDLPAELSVAGFDDTTLARCVWPALTTVRQPVEELAHAATTALLAGDLDSHREHPFHLVLRQSVAPPAGVAT